MLSAEIEEQTGDLPIVGRRPVIIPSPGTEWPDLEASRTFLQRFDHEMRLVRQAADAGGTARYPVDFSLGMRSVLTDVDELRAMERLLELSSYVNSHDNNYSKVIQTCDRHLNRRERRKRRPRGCRPLLAAVQFDTIFSGY